MKHETWAQLKNITADKLISAMDKDGWQLRTTGSSSRRVFVKGSNLVSIHYHPHKAYGPDMLKNLLQDTGWTEADLKRLKLIR
jgi:predicted RNA binding protein YcfA (HicA-like mRNA interferase family)